MEGRGQQEEKYPLPLLGIEPRFFGLTVHSVVTVLTIRHSAKFSPVSCYFLSLRHKYLPKHPISHKYLPQHPISHKYLPRHPITHKHLPQHPISHKYLPRHRITHKYLPRHPISHKYLPQHPISHKYLPQHPISHKYLPQHPISHKYLPRHPITHKYLPQHPISHKYLPQHPISHKYTHAHTHSFNKTVLRTTRMSLFHAYGTNNATGCVTGWPTVPCNYVGFSHYLVQSITLFYTPRRAASQFKNKLRSYRLYIAVKMTTLGRFLLLWDTKSIRQCVTEGGFCMIQLTNAPIYIM
jgi:hypothetical protein